MASAGAGPSAFWVARRDLDSPSCRYPHESPDISELIHMQDIGRTVPKECGKHRLRASFPSFLESTPLKTKQMAQGDFANCGGKAFLLLP
jgi:hypothetical protein